MFCRVRFFAALYDGPRIATLWLVDSSRAGPARGDPADDKFFELAVNGYVELIVSEWP
jgi:hypothetical protein